MIYFHMNLFRKAFLLLALLAFSPTGCEMAEAASPNAGTLLASYSSRGTSTLPAARAGGRAEVIVKSVKFLGGPRTIHHEVGPMETIWRLSRMYDVSPQSIYSANRLSPKDSLRIGQKLVIPNARMIRHVINIYRNPQWKYIILHHTATGKGNSKTIHGSHRQRGFRHGLGYHFLIDNGTLGKGDGQIEMSPRWIHQQPGAHCKAGGMNEKAIGISLVGNFNHEKPTPNQMQSLAFLLSTLRNYYRIPSSHIFRHRDVPGARTECPGKLLPKK